MRKKTGSLAPAWDSSLITSCSRMEREGTPIPWEMLSTGPTLNMEYLWECFDMSCRQVPGGGLKLISLMMKWAKVSIRYAVPPMHTN